jgi:hypothetical protein
MLEASLSEDLIPQLVMVFVNVLEWNFYANVRCLKELEKQVNIKPYNYLLS